MTDKTDRGGVDREPNVDTTRFEWDSTETPSVAVCRGVAAVRGVEATDLTPLHGSIDTEALDRIVGRGTDGSDGTVRVSFRYEGLEVIVDSGRTIELRIPDESLDDEAPA